MSITGSPVNDSTNVQEVEVRNGALSTTSPYLDLGLVADGASMAAGAVVASNWIDNVQWVRNIKIMSQSDQTYDIQVEIRDTASSNSGGYVTVLASGQTATGGATSFRATSFTGANGLLGYSAKFSIKNSSASPNTFGRLRVQLMGV